MYVFIQICLSTRRELTCLFLRLKIQTLTKQISSDNIEQLKNSKIPVKFEAELKIFFLARKRKEQWYSVIKGGEKV